jgi:hypothetical protein
MPLDRRDVRYCPKSRHSHRRSGCLLSAKSGHSTQFYCCQPQASEIERVIAMLWVTSGHSQLPSNVRFSIGRLIA